MSISICFFFPYKEVSGVPVLFYRLANKLAKEDRGNKIFIIDYIDGAMARNIIEIPNLVLIPFVDGVNVTPPVDSILIMQSILPYGIRPELKIKGETRICFWNLHPNNLIPVPFPYFISTYLLHKNFSAYYIISKFISPSKIRHLNSFLDTAIKKKGLFFMDYPNLSKTCKYLFRSEPEVDFLPVPAFESIELKIRSNQSDKELNFTWIGRLCDFKSHILIYTIRKLSNLALRKNIDIKYSIIGEGPFRSKLEKLNVNNDKFKLKLLGLLNEIDLDEFLLSNTDVLTAMGTSALEGAKLGIPTILLDMSYHPIVGDYQFRWLFNTENFDLGHDISMSDMDKNNLTLDFMVNELLENYDKLSIRTLRYFQLNHHIDSVCEKFRENISKSELVYSDIDKKVLRKSFVRTFYETIKYSKF